MRVRLKVKSNIYGEDKEGQEYLIKRGVVKTLSLDIHDIGPVTDAFNDKGDILKTFCEVHIQDIGFVKVNHSREYVENLKDHIVITGFRRGKKQ